MSKELNLMNQKIVHSLTKCTTVDYENHLSCVVWFIGCNLRCLYCYNDDLVYSKIGNYDLDYVLEFLKKRVALLDSVVLSGGEATCHDLREFCKAVKKLGFKIKLDTNGINLKQIKELVEKKLIDYIALDFKANKKNFYLLTKTNYYDRWIETLSYLIQKEFNFEVRTTVNTNLLSESDINEMIDVLYEKGYKNSYYIQNYIQTSTNLGNILGGDFIKASKLNAQKISLQFRNEIAL